MGENLAASSSVSSFNRLNTIAKCLPQRAMSHIRKLVFYYITHNWLSCHFINKYYYHYGNKWHTKMVSTKEYEVKINRNSWRGMVSKYNTFGKLLSLSGLQDTAWEISYYLHCTEIINLNLPFPGVSDNMFCYLGGDKAFSLLLLSRLSYSFGLNFYSILKEKRY